ncbi:phosphatase [Enterococcus florum]|uniref:Phosphatase n=1 Tax=Enterococcus florum TaxID=2480627 RepID=A0A4V0WPC2_9ENTE|nr:tyrosine-protein phosphatase [Enterococcus florum]GCF93349.1 phosphatase [Enterococcus florum]
MEQLLSVNHAENMRELGGYQTKDGRTVGSRRLIRSASINLLDDHDKAYLADYGVKTVIDFRSPEEREAQPDQEIPHSANIALPIFPIDENRVSASPLAVMTKMQGGYSAFDQMIEVYRNFVSMEHVHHQYQRFFELILSNERPDQSILFHCTAGKDRTGFGAALILSGLGVDQETIFRDYMKTNQFLKKKVAEIREQAIQAGVPESLLHGVDDMMTARLEYLQTSYDQIHQQYGDVVNFLKQGIGLSNGDIQDLQKLYLV